MKVILIFLIIILFSCSNNNIINHNIKEKKKKETEEKKEKQKINEVKADELSRLFFKDYVKTEKKITKDKEIRVKEIIQIEKIDAADYIVIIDWMVNGVRYLKLKNKKSMNEYIIKEGDTNSSIILLERTLFTYKFKIDGQIIEVKR